MEKFSTDDKIALSDYRITKALEALEDSKVTFNNKRHKVTVNRAYHAVLHAY